MIRNDQAIIAAMQVKATLLQTKNVVAESNPVLTEPESEPQADSILDKITQLLHNFQPKDKTS